jgi:hypothetical protein
MSLGALLLGAAGGYANTHAAKQQSEYKDAKLQALIKGEPMPQAPKSLGSQLVDKVKDALPTFGYDGNKSNYAKTPDVATASVLKAKPPQSSDAEYSEAFNDDSTVSSEPTTFQNSYGKGRS